MKHTANTALVRCVIAMAFSSRTNNKVRLGKPVKASSRGHAFQQLLLALHLADVDRHPQRLARLARLGREQGATHVHPDGVATLSSHLKLRAEVAALLEHWVRSGSLAVQGMVDTAPRVFSQYVYCDNPSYHNSCVLLANYSP